MRPSASSPSRALAIVLLAAAGGSLPAPLHAGTGSGIGTGNGIGFGGRGMTGGGIGVPSPRYTFTRLPRTGAVPLCYDPSKVAELAQLEARAEARGYARQIAALARRSFGNRRGAVRQQGLDEIREFIDPAALRPLIRGLIGEREDVQRVLIDHLASCGAEGQGALAFYAILATDRAMRDEAMRRIARPFAEEVLRDLDAALRSTQHVIVNGAGVVAGQLGALPTIPLLIFAQATEDRVRRTGDLAWIVIGTQTTYVANLIPVVGGNAGAFQPVLGVVNEGTLLRVMDAVAVTYRIDVHNALVSMTGAEWGQSTSRMGYDMRQWYAWYNETFVPFVEERALLERMAEEVAAPPPSEGTRPSTPPPASKSTSNSTLGDSDGTP